MTITPAIHYSYDVLNDHYTFGRIPFLAKTVLAEFSKRYNAEIEMVYFKFRYLGKNYQVFPQKENNKIISLHVQYEPEEK